MCLLAVPLLNGTRSVQLSRSGCNVGYKTEYNDNLWESQMQVTKAVFCKLFGQRYSFHVGVNIFSAYSR